MGDALRRSRCRWTCWTLWTRGAICSPSNARTVAASPSVSTRTRKKLEALDRELDRTTAQIEAAVRDLERARLAERADRFAAALHDGGILPEDF